MVELVLFHVMGIQFIYVYTINKLFTKLLSKQTYNKNFNEKVTVKTFNHHKKTTYELKITDLEFILFQKSLLLICVQYFNTILMVLYLIY